MTGKMKTLEQFESTKIRSSQKKPVQKTMLSHYKRWGNTM